MKHQVEELKAADVLECCSLFWNRGDSLKYHATLAIAVVSMSFVWSAEAQSFRRLPPLPGPHHSNGRDISDDGQFAAGGSTSASGNRGVRWTGSVPQDVGTIGSNYPWPDQTIAWGISGDGSTVVGSSDLSTSPTQMERHAYRWNSGTLLDLNPILGTAYAQAIDASTDGDYVAGTFNPSGTADYHVFRYRHSTGVVDDLGAAPSGFSSIIPYFSFSDDGQTIASGTHRWRNGSGWAPIPNLGRGLATSATGEFIAGSYSQGPVDHAFVWQESSGQFIDLGSLGLSSIAWGVSADGATVVGQATHPTNPSSAFWWQPGMGMRDLNVDFASVIPAGWHLVTAYGVTPDGMHIVGSGTNEVGATEGYVLRVPTPSALGLAGWGALAALARRRR